MSRSRKKPIVKDYNKGSKAIANRKVRQRIKSMFSFSKGNWYRKIFCSYDISDWKFVADKKDDWYEKFKRK